MLIIGVLRDYSLWLENEIEEQENVVEKNQESGRPVDYFVSRIHLMGLERCKYLLSAYLHTRIAKVS